MRTIYVVFSYVERYEKARQRYEALEKKKAEAEEKIKAIDRFIYSLSVSGNIITEFDDTLWLITVDRVIAETDGTLIFVFKDGRQIPG